MHARSDSEYYNKELAVRSQLELIIGKLFLNNILPFYSSGLVQFCC